MAEIERPHLSESGGVDIVIRDVTKTYETDAGPVHALQPFDLEIKAGEFVVLVGPSGCGKTTMLRMLGGLIGPTQGDILVGGNPLFPRIGEPASRAVLGRLGFVFQDANLLPWRRIWRNIVLPLEIQGARRSEMRQRAEFLAAQMGIEGFLGHYPSALSGGMRQRAAIARALSHDPSILLMDEPFGALDAMTRDSMNELLQDVWMETHKTVVLVTHSIAEAAFLADRVVLLSSRPGRIEDVVEVPFPRPRRLELTKDPAFGGIVERLRRQLGDVESRSVID